MIEALQWAATLAVLLTQYLLARPARVGWLCGAAAALLWGTYGWITDQDGLLLANTVLLAISATGWRNSAPDESDGRVLKGHCCDMARKFEVGVLRVREGDMPIEAAEFVIDWRPSLGEDDYVNPKAEDDRALPSVLGGKASRIMLGARYCQWCGSDISVAAIDRHYRRKLK